MKNSLKPLGMYFPISRVDDDERIVEGYVYVNEIVQGEGGVRLKRSAMEAATPEYAQFGNIREMHQPSAVGTTTAPGCGITWDAKGCYIRAKIDDDQAWAKIKGGTYKGFSIYVAPTLMRGKDVHSCRWVETSLVDRMKDPDSFFTIFRAEGVNLTPDLEFECEVEEEELEIKRDFNSMMAVNELADEGYEAFMTLYDAVWQIQYDDTIEDKGAAVRESVSQFADYLAGMVSAGNIKKRGDLVAAGTAIVRGVFGDNWQEEKPVNEQISTLIQRLEATDSELVIARAELATRAERIEELERMERPAKTPVRFTQGLERAFMANRATEPVDEHLQSLQDELAELGSKPQKTEELQLKAISRMQVIKQQLAISGKA